jgi:hypothetical protein
MLRQAGPAILPNSTFYFFLLRNFFLHFKQRQDSTLLLENGKHLAQSGLGGVAHVEGQGLHVHVLGVVPRPQPRVQVREAPRLKGLAHRGGKARLQHATVDGRLV